MARLKLATFNINGVRARQLALLDWLKREQPDIACLQELKAPDEAFPIADLERIGYGAIWHGQKSWNGVAILARGSTPVERRRGLPEDPDGSQSRYLEAEINGLVVGCLYLPNGNPWPGPKFDYKLAWFDELIRHAATLLDEGLPTVLAGDFNVVPTDALDIYDAKSWRKDALLQPESREAFVRLLKQGWTDALRTVHGDEKVFTFWDYFRKHWERNAGLRIDHLLLSRSLAPTLKDANVDRWVRGEPGASDHAPTWIELAIGSATARKPAVGDVVRKAAGTPARTKASIRSEPGAHAGPGPVSARKTVRRPAKTAAASPSSKATPGGSGTKKPGARDSPRNLSAGEPADTQKPAKKTARRTRQTK